MEQIKFHIIDNDNIIEQSLTYTGDCVVKRQQKYQWRHVNPFTRKVYVHNAYVEYNLNVNVVLTKQQSETLFNMIKNLDQDTQYLAVQCSDIVYSCDQIELPDTQFYNDVQTLKFKSYQEDLQMESES